jgi:hypothetical protein
MRKFYGTPLALACPSTGPDRSTTRSAPVKHKKIQIMNKKYQKTGVDAFHPSIITAHIGNMPFNVLCIV